MHGWGANILWHLPDVVHPRCWSEEGLLTELGSCPVMIADPKMLSQGLIKGH